MAGKCKHVLNEVWDGTSGRSGRWNALCPLNFLLRFFFLVKYLGSRFGPVGNGLVDPIQNLCTDEVFLTFQFQKILLTKDSHEEK